MQKINIDLLSKFEAHIPNSSIMLQNPVVEREINPLTENQKDILLLAMNGYSPTEIAQCREGKVKTVRNHLYDINNRLGTTCLSGAIVAAEHLRIVEFPEAVDNSIGEPSARLSDCEQLIVQGLFFGITTQQIAQSLQKSPKTVKNQLGNVFNKTKTVRQTQLLAWTAQNAFFLDPPVISYKYFKQRNAD